MASSGIHKPYQDAFLFGKTNDFYIHAHHYCIGRANKGSSNIDDKDLGKFFASQRVDALAVAKNYYTKLFIESIGLTSREWKFLSEAFEIQDKQELIKQLEQEMSTALSKAMDRSLIKKGMSTQTDLISDISDILNNDTKIAVQGFNTLLENLNRAIQLIQNPELSNALGNMLLNAKRTYAISTQDMGKKIQEALNRFERKYANQLQEVQHENIVTVIKSIRSFANTLIKGKTSQGDSLTQENIKNIADAMFNPGFSEVIASQLKQTAKINVEDALIHYTGDKGVKADFTDPFGQPLQEKLRNRTASGKKDFGYSNIKIKGKTSTGKTFELKMNIGISNKSYRAAEFSPNGKGQLNAAFSSGSGGTLKEVIRALFSSAEDRYLMYNTIAHWKDLPEATGDLNDLILSRQIVRLLSARGGVKDFASHIFFNGEVISMSQILDYITNYTSKESSSQKGSSAIALSIPDRPDIAIAVKNPIADQRVPQVNKIINSATVMVHVHIKKLTQGLKNLKSKKF